jgi:hypothetical protein
MRLPLLRRSSSIDYRNASASRSKVLYHVGTESSIWTIAVIVHYDAMMKTRRCVMSRLSLPARSLRGRPASLRTVPDGAGGLFRKRLICRALLVMRRAISGVEPIFLPALRERGQLAHRRDRGYRTNGFDPRHWSNRGYGTRRSHRQNWCDGCHRPANASPSAAAAAHGEHSPILSQCKAHARPVMSADQVRTALAKSGMTAAACEPLPAFRGCQELGSNTGRSFRDGPQGRGRNP